MDGRKIMVAALGGLLFIAAPGAVFPPPVCSVAKAAADSKARNENGEQKPPRQKGGQPEVLTYERAMEIENNRHQRKLEAIRRSYRHHPPKRRLATRRENDFHAKRVEEIKKRFGML